MAKFNVIKNSFIAGEISPKSEGRTDIPQYPHSSKILENCISQPQGGALRRPGTRYIKTTANGSAKLIPFIISNSESYVVEICSGAIHCINVSSGTVSTPTLLGTGAWAPDISYLQPSQIQYTQSADFLWLVTAEYKPQILIRTAQDTFQLMTFSYVNQAFPGITGDTNNSEWMLWPFQKTNTDVLSTVTPTGTLTTGGTVTLTASKSIFNPGMLNTLFRFSQPTGTVPTPQTAIVRITGYTSATVVTGTVVRPIFSTTPTDDWQLPAWYGNGNWPQTICFFRDRLLFGGTAAFPDTIFGSKTNSYFQLMTDRFEEDLQPNPAGSTNYNTSGNNYIGGPSQPLASDPVRVVLSAQQVNQIQWINAGSYLAVGTLGAEYVATSLDPTGNNPADIHLETSYGSAPIPAVRIGFNNLYVSRNGRELYQMEFDFRVNAYVSTDLMQWADHMPTRRGGLPGFITCMEYQPRKGVLWFCDVAGALFSMTRQKDQQMAAWNYHSIAGPGTGGAGPDGNNPAFVNSICVIPSSELLSDDVWICTNRVINGSTVSFVEVIGREFEMNSLNNSAITALDATWAPYFSDAAVFKNNGSPTTTFSGFSHLIGQTVSVLADGYVQAPVTVSGGGTITLPNAATWVVAGLPYTPKIKTSRLEAGATLGSSQGAIKRIDRAVVRFYNTVAASLGPDEQHLQPLNFRTQLLTMDTPVPMFSGDQVVEYDGDYDRDYFVYIECPDPVPFCVLSVTFRGETYEV